MMGLKDLFLAVAVFIGLNGCAANYSQDATGVSTGESDLNTARTTLSDTRAQVIQTYYNVKRTIHNAAPLPTATCHEFVASAASQDDQRDCFIWDKDESKDIERERRAAEAAARSHGVSLPSALPASPLPPSPSPTRLTDEQIRAKLKEYHVPDVCIDYAFTEGGTANPTSQALAPDAEQEAYLNSLPTQDRIFMALDGYTKGLAAITKQSDVDDYKAAATKLATSVGSLATAAGALAGGVGAVVAGPVATATTKLITDIQLAALQAERYRALRSAVLAACIPIHAIGIGESDFLSTEYDEIQIYNQKTINAIRTASPQMQKSNNEVLLHAVTAFNSPTPPPTHVVNAFVKAHDKLMEDVLSGKGQSQVALQEIGGFADDAKALKDALQTKKAKSAGGS